ncbi:DNA adenine methylase [bacterium]|nr:DNA adenine methylase [bacterium]
MKYMGSKRAMLMNGLGSVLREESKNTTRFVDLFSGSGSVAWFAATDLKMEVLSLDLQKYSCILAKSVIERTKAFDSTATYEKWAERAKIFREGIAIWKEAKKLDQSDISIDKWQAEAQAICLEEYEGNIVSRAYGGFYFSPTQAITFDSLLHTMPTNTDQMSECLAALIISASQCAAAPGHTAQAFKANSTAGPFLKEAWHREPLNYVCRGLNKLSALYAYKKGKAKVGDANLYSKELNKSDLVFIDPPYSGVHYSRFYHVLETIAKRKRVAVAGIGRYPPLDQRPRSEYSMRSTSEGAIRNLLSNISSRGAKVVMTYPMDKSSNGLSGQLVEEIASEHFSVEKKLVKSRFSTMGGNSKNRDARSNTDELIIVLNKR